MATFNSMPAMSSGAATGDSIGMSHASAQPLVMEGFDQELSFDDALLDGAALPPLPFTPAYDFDNFANSTFEDPFIYARQFEPPPKQEAHNDESSPQELDNKLLGFSDPVMHATVADDSGKFADVTMSAELYGMFFVAEDVFGGDNSEGRPLELTCYRRNLWQCSGQITLSRGISHIIDEHGNQLPISELSASITAAESIEGKATEIISIPWKSSNAPPGEDIKVAAAPPHITLDMSSGHELDANLVSIPVSWKRLQFKHATANNGRRKGLQQHYVVQINLLGKTTSGDTIKITEIQSGPVIVRGRSPRNFDSRKDVPLTGEKKLERKNTAGSEGTAAKPGVDNMQATTVKTQSSTPIQTNDWTNPQSFTQPQPTQSPHPSKRVAMSPSVVKPPIPSWSRESNGATKLASQLSHHQTRPQNTSLPISLSLSEDERSPNRSSAELQSPRLGKAINVVGLNAGSSPPEEADPLYEYFPLTVDDWTPPVDAVYRPHVVHHTIVPPEVKAQQMQSKTKRYFAAD
ncbi:acid phosphatase [Stachybotrys elegans]|uniref:Acid phosphatase n=1 Tax=Stachybotrys elegans TaxID=80388 RepID=A0A8K0SWF6_9HYPO|nr:acid phosphatase [Stachybotrys elegans]